MRNFGDGAAVHFVWRSHAAAAMLLLLAGGCQSQVGPAPAGPGAATDRDLTPWLATATETEQFGYLMQINVPSTQGNYVTWGLETPQAEQSVEVDVRACAGAAGDFRNKCVIVRGKSIGRGKHHLALIVAEQIWPADERGNALPDFATHIAMAPELDPATDQCDPMIDFQTSSSVITASAN